MGWIKLDRQIQDHWLWEGRFSKGQAWIDLLLLANHDDVKMPYKGEIITCKRGDVNRSMLWLAERWGWSRKAVKHFLGLLEQDGMVTTRVTTNRTVITLINWEKYQSKEFEGSNEGINEGYNEGSNEGNNEGNTNKKDKKDKKDKKYIYRFLKPTINEIKAYCQERNNNIDPEQFFDYYESKGWMIGKNHMKDWKASVRTWENRRKGEYNGTGSTSTVRADEEKRNAEIDRYLESDEYRSLVGTEADMPFM